MKIKPGAARLPEDEKFKMLFELHHRQLREAHISLRSTTERVVAIFALIVGWMVLSSATPSSSMKAILIGGVTTIALTSILILYLASSGRKRVAKVIQKLSHKLELYEANSYTKDNSPLYPDEWKSHGSEAAVLYVLPHITVVFIMAILAALSILTK